jgi:hypothetical protein
MLSKAIGGIFELLIVLSALVYAAFWLAALTIFLCNIIF